MPHAERIPSIDGLRGIAAITVMLYHFGPDYFSDNKYIEWLWFGDYGPQIFFMISGLVIGLISSKRTSRTHFIRKRYERLMPTYWAALSLTSVVLLAFGQTLYPDHLVQYLANITLAHEIIGIDHMDAVYWTLIVEIIFYIIFAFLFLPIKTVNNKTYLLSLWLAISYVNLTVRALEAETHWLFLAFRQVFVLDYAPLFIIGIIMSLLKQGMHHKGFLILIMGCYLHTWILYPANVAAYLSGAFVFFSALVFHNSPLLSSKYLLIIGWISYPLYLLHREIGYLIIRQFEVYEFPVLLGVVFAFSLSLVLAYGFSAYFDKKGKPQ